MAIFYPDFEVINSAKVKPEEGELYLLNFLKDNYDDSYEVFFQPFLNGDRPDVIIMRKNYGIMIIEVKDWNLSNYYLDDRRKWRLRHNDAYLKSPIDQVLHYKENIYNLHIESLLEKKIKNFKYWALVSCAVYFHNATSRSLDELLIAPYQNDKKYQDFLKYNADVIGRDNVNTNWINSVFRKRYIISHRHSFLFDEDLYNSFKRYLKPTFHSKDEGVEIKYSEQQKRLIKSEPREQRVKGVVGSGKTTVLATRAVNSFIRTNNKVLILCYNITLKNYIHDKLSKVREDFSWDCFYINNYHNFITSEMNNQGIEIRIPPDFSNWSQEQKSSYFEDNYYSNVSLFLNAQEKFTKYKAILIDEIQDYKRPWMDVIKTCFLVPNGEYVLFGDVKQNIYDNLIENKDISTNVKGAPSVLKDCFRSVKKIKDIAIDFQRQHFENKYEIDDFNKTMQLSLNYENPSFVNYIYLDTNIDVPKLYDFIKKYSKQLNEHPNDITILGFQISVLREFECYYRYKSNEKTNTMFETQEVWYKLFLQTFKKNEVVSKGISFFAHVKSDDDKKNYLAVLLALKDLISDTGEDCFKTWFDRYAVKHKINQEEFNDWYNSEQLHELLNRDKQYSLRKLEAMYPEYRQLTNQLKFIRDNKKIHFWYNRGTIKLSTIHSFKGWEANTLFLILEEQFDNSDFFASFDELIYTALTRSKTNLIVLNYGNKVHHEQMVSLFDNYNTEMLME